MSALLTIATSPVLDGISTGTSQSIQASAMSAIDLAREIECLTGRPHEGGPMSGHASRTPSDRFWAMVERTDGCWRWKGTTRGGYGRFHLNGALVEAHRYSFLLHGGTIPDGEWVLHNCPEGDTPGCVNPAHLWTGTPGGNARDRESKGRSKSASQTHCKRGHQFTDSNTRIGHGGRRVCRTCSRELMRTKRANRRIFQDEQLSVRAR